MRSALEHRHVWPSGLATPWALDALVSVKSQQLIHDQDVMRQLLAWYITQARALTIEGPTGCGKTEAAAAFVAALGQPYLLAECHRNDVA